MHRPASGGPLRFSSTLNRSGLWPHPQPPLRHPVPGKLSHRNGGEGGGLLWKEGGGSAAPLLPKTPSPSPGKISKPVVHRGRGRGRQGVGAGCPVRLLAIRCSPSRSCGTRDSFTHAQGNGEEKRETGVEPKTYHPRFDDSFDRTVEGQRSAKLRTASSCTGRGDGELGGNEPERRRRYTTGSSTLNTAPPPSRLAAEILPPCASTSCRAMASPRPLPPRLRSRPRSAR